MPCRLSIVVFFTMKKCVWIHGNKWSLLSDFYINCPIFNISHNFSPFTLFFKSNIYFTKKEMISCLAHNCCFLIPFILFISHKKRNEMKRSRIWILFLSSCIFCMFLTSQIKVSTTSIKNMKHNCKLVLLVDTLFRYILLRISQREASDKRSNKSKTVCDLLSWNTRNFLWT